MKFEPGKERFTLTEKEANIFVKAFDLLRDIYNDSETEAGGYAADALDAIDSLINNGSDSEYEIGVITKDTTLVKITL